MWCDSSIILCNVTFGRQSNRIVHRPLQKQQSYTTMTLCKSCCKLEQSTVGTIQNCCVEEHVYDGNEGTCANKQRVFFSTRCCVLCGVGWLLVSSRRSTSYDSWHLSGKITRVVSRRGVVCVVWCGVVAGCRSRRSRRGCLMILGISLGKYNKSFFLDVLCRWGHYEQPYLTSNLQQPEDRPNSTNTMVAIAFVLGEWSLSCHRRIISR